MSDQSINFKYIWVSLLAVLFTWILHEFTHWITSALLGYDSIMTLNSVSYESGQNPTEGHKAIVSISGPIITLSQGFIIFHLLNTKVWDKYLFPFLFTALYMRFLAGLINFINVNDEGRVSQYLGLGTFTLSILVIGVLFFLVYKISKKYSINWKFQVKNYLLVMIFSSILILSDQFFGFRIL